MLNILFIRNSRLRVHLLSAAVTIAALVVGLILGSPSHAAEADPASCSIYDAVYKPHPIHYPDVPALEKPKSLTFTLTAHEPPEGEKGGSHRSIFFYIDAFDAETGEKVSTLRMADTCSNGVVRCAISTYEGQFNPNEKMKEFKYGLGFDPIALRKDLSRTEYYGPEAPYAFVLQDTLRVVYTYQKQKTEAERTSDAAQAEEFIRYYTPEKVFPDFGGNDVWIMDSCGEPSE